MICNFINEILPESAELEVPTTTPLLTEVSFLPNITFGETEPPTDSTLSENLTVSDMEDTTHLFTTQPIESDLTTSSTTVQSRSSIPNSHATSQVTTLLNWLYVSESATVDADETIKNNEVTVPTTRYPGIYSSPKTITEETLDDFTGFPYSNLL